jgi:molybdopterin synthase sulfur carrier subunit
MKTIEVVYFALLRDKANKTNETIEINASTLKELYQELSGRYDFELPAEMIQVAVNDEFTSINSPLLSQSKVVFIPPVAGG